MIRVCHSCGLLYHSWNPHMLLRIHYSYTSYFRQIFHPSVNDASSQILYFAFKSKSVLCITDDSRSQTENAHLNTMRAKKASDCWPPFQLNATLLNIDRTSLSSSKYSYSWISVCLACLQSKLHTRSTDYRSGLTFRHPKPTIYWR